MTTTESRSKTPKAGPSGSTTPSAVFSEVDIKDFAALDDRMKQSLQGMGIERMTKIQAESFTKILAATDVMIQSPTGSGKTLAFVAPLVQRLATARKVTREEGLFILVVCPTHELALQISQECNKLMQKHYYWMISSTLVGGEKKKAEKARLRKGVNLLISTPGRLLDHLQTTTSWVMENLSAVVLDEADRLAEMGFEEKIVKSLSLIQSRVKKTKPDFELAKVQKILTSATLDSDRVRKFVNRLGMREPAKIYSNQQTLVNTESPSEVETPAFQLPPGLHQFYSQVPTRLRLVTLMGFLRWKMVLQQTPRVRKAVVFLSCIDSVEFHHRIFTETYLPSFPDAHNSHPFNTNNTTTSKSNVNLRKISPTTTTTTTKQSDTTSNQHAHNGEEEADSPNPFFGSIRILKLHGDMNQPDRGKVFTEFKNASHQVLLLCTDVAARGLDFPHVDWIVQYDTPGDPKEYIHRVGRTARLDSEGNALLFLMPHEMSYLQLLQFYEMKLEQIDLDIILQSHIVAFGRTSRNSMDAAMSLQHIIEDEINQNDELKQTAADAFGSYIKAYATHSKETKEIFHHRMLHIGHVASSFGLTDKPSKLAIKGRSQSKTKRMTTKAEDIKKRFERKNKRYVKSTASDADAFSSDMVEQEPEAAATTSAPDTRQQQQQQQRTPMGRVDRYKEFLSDFSTQDQSREEEEKEGKKQEGETRKKGAFTMDEIAQELADQQKKMQAKRSPVDMDDDAAQQEEDEMTGGDGTSKYIRAARRVRKNDPRFIKNLDERHKIRSLLSNPFVAASASATNRPPKRSLSLVSEFADGGVVGGPLKKKRKTRSR